MLRRCFQTLSKSQPGLRLLSVVSLSRRTSATRAHGELNRRPGREPENSLSLSLSLRWRAAATGDETAPLWAASPGAGREFTTYSETHTSTLFAYIVVKQKRERERQNTSQTDSIVTFPFSLLPLQITCTALHFHCRLRTPNFVFTAAPFKYTITRAHALSPPVLTITRQNENHVDINLRYCRPGGIAE